MPSDPVGVAVLSLSWAASVLLAVSLWRKPGHPATRIAWTVLLAVPVAGPVAFLVLHDPPKPRVGCGGCAPARSSGEEPLTLLGRAGPGREAEGPGPSA